eukprot:7074413-Pyramimonas_sp.AAC.1
MVLPGARVQRGSRGGPDGVAVHEVHDAGLVALALQVWCEMTKEFYQEYLKKEVRRSRLAPLYPFCTPSGPPLDPLWTLAPGNPGCSQRW